MRRIFVLALAVVAAVAFAAAPVAAQPPGPPGGGKDRAIQGKSKRMSGGGEHRAEDAGQLAAQLGLAGKDKKSFIKTLARMNEKKKAAQDKLKGLMANLRQDMKKEASDKKIASTLDEINAAFDSLDAIRKSVREDIGKILTPMQHAKFLLMNRGGGTDGRRPKMPTPPGR
ncbi:MAG: hypothetical protein KAR83_01975 [Thermodesulfovibrionales bacterium]|nr:hypothetical protein [Thermodesulfovibrionales bacterium]